MHSAIVPLDCKHHAYNISIFIAILQQPVLKTLIGASYTLIYLAVSSIRQLVVHKLTTYLIFALFTVQNSLTNSNFALDYSKEITLRFSSAVLGVLLSPSIIFSHYGLFIFITGNTKCRRIIVKL